jgi:ferredoxin
MPSLTCLKHKKIYQIKQGQELLKAYQLDPSLPFCFGCTKGQCGVCAIKVVEGMENFSKKTTEEKATLQTKQLDPSYRLACQCAILGDVVIESTLT